MKKVFYYPTYIDLPKLFSYRTIIRKKPKAIIDGFVIDVNIEKRSATVMFLDPPRRT